MAFKSGKQKRQEMLVDRKSRKERKVQLLKASSFLSGNREPVSKYFLELYKACPDSPRWPEFIRNGFYEDKLFKCVDCGEWWVWKAERQKWWYEEANGHWDSTAIRCAPCREKKRLDRMAARKMWELRLENKLKKQGA